MRRLLVDFGSTFTKGVLVDTDAGGAPRLADAPTRLDGEILDSLFEVQSRLGLTPGLSGDRSGGLAGPDGVEVLACSSAGGGLRIAVIGYEAEVTAEAGRRVALSAGGRVVHVAAGELTPAQVRALRAERPDIVLLVGGTDGGNGSALVHNAERLAAARLAVPIVVAGNIEAADEASAALRSTERRFTVTDNVLPRIGRVAPAAARAAIRSSFLAHVIGGKHLSRSDLFEHLVRAPTPDVVLRGVEVLGDALGEDVLVVDVGGATSDVYSLVRPDGEANLPREVVGTLAAMRTVEADLGMRWSATGVIEGAALEGIDLDPGLAEHAARAAATPGLVATDPPTMALDAALARVAATVAVRRHARAQSPGEQPRELGAVTLVVGSGGILRALPVAAAEALVTGLAQDHGGGWRTPLAARGRIDAGYALLAGGLLAERYPDESLEVTRRAFDR